MCVELDILDFNIIPINDGLYCELEKKVFFYQDFLRFYTHRKLNIVWIFLSISENS